MGKLQNEDFKTEAELTGAGGAKSQLLNDTKIYVTANSINKTLDDAIIDGDIGGGGGSAEVCVLSDVKTIGTNGGSFTSGAWQTRDLNTISGGGTFCSLSANRFTLQAGTYLLVARAPAHQVNRHQCRLVEDPAGTATEVKTGSSQIAGSGVATGNNSHLIHQFTIASATVYEIQHQAQTTSSIVGFGVQSGFSDEVYTEVEIIKVS